jgi:predicted enzyme related to lactoylglutathione lyase
MLGRFVWHELMTSDTKSAAAFFSKVIGWKPMPWDRDPGYTTFMLGRRYAAGLMRLPEDARAMGAQPSWCTYVGTPDVDGTARLLVSLGGKIIRQPWDIPTVGRISIVQDPQGAVFGLYMASQEEAETQPGVGEFSWHELATTDWRSALSFYQRLFNWEPTSAMEMGPELGTYQMFGRNGTPLGGMYTRPPHVSQSYWLPYIKVADSRKTAAVVKRLNGKILSGPMEVPGGDWIFVGADLQGAQFAVHSSKPAAATKRTARKAVAKSARRASAARARVASTRGKKRATKKRATTRTARKARSTRGARKQRRRARRS